MSSTQSTTELFRLSIIWRLLLIMIGLILVFGVVAHWLEPETFLTFFDGIWWAIVTTFTVGYGDLVPATYAGRLTAIVLILLGTGFGSYFMISFATEMLNRQYNKQMGASAATCTEHFIIVGWNERIKLLLRSQALSTDKIVLIDETLSNVPKEFATRLFFVKGCPYHDDILQRAGVMAAHTILITADQEKEESSADTSSIMTILAAKGMNPSLRCIVEILTIQQIDNAKRAGATEIIEINQLMSYILSTTLLYPTGSETLVSLFSQSAGAKLQLMSPTLTANTTFFQQCQLLLEENVIVIGVKRDGKDYINPPHPFFLQEGDTLITVTR